jgi:hypothetical protein
MNPRSSFSSTFSRFNDFETDNTVESFSNVSGTLTGLAFSETIAGLRWELKDLLSKDDNVGSDFPDEDGPVNEAG